jgi:hypothetical protein
LATRGDIDLATYGDFLMAMGRPEGPRRASEGLVLAHSVVGPGVLHGGSVVIFAVFPYPDKPIGGYATISGGMTTGRGVWGR